MGTLKLPNSLAKLRPAGRNKALMLILGSAGNY